MRPLATGLPQHFVVAVAAAAVFRYVTMRNAILTCAQKLTRVSLIYRTEPTTKSGEEKEGYGGKDVLEIDLTTDSYLTAFVE